MILLFVIEKLISAVADLQAQTREAPANQALRPDPTVPHPHSILLPAFLLLLSPEATTGKSIHFSKKLTCLF